MTAELNWFVAEAVFEATVLTDDTEVRAITENLLFLVRARDHAAASTRATVIAGEKEHAYHNDKGQPVRWRFVTLVDVVEMIDQRFEDGAELKSTMTLDEPK